jgi:hypothetical protein
LIASVRSQGLSFARGEPATRFRLMARYGMLPYLAVRFVADLLRSDVRRKSVAFTEDQPA